MAEDTVPVACTLTTKDAAARVVEWSDVRDRSQSIDRIEGGLALTLPGEMREPVEDLARREAGCCAFLALNTSMRGDDLRLEITAETEDGRAVIDLMIGADPR